MNNVKIIKTFEKVYSNYKEALSLKELIQFGEQLVNNGYCLELNRDGTELRPRATENPGFIENIKRISAERNNIDLCLTPAQEYMYTK